ncbi:MAG: hypothetical protein ACRDHL_07280, partial [Candidatus Promineifilaceae bacterium]
VLAAGLRRRDLALLERGLELLLPPYSSLALASLVLTSALLAWEGLEPMLGAAGMAAVSALWLLAPIAGLLADRAPLACYRALLRGPAYLVWRGWIGIQSAWRGEQITWVRTPRREEG